MSGFHLLRRPFTPSLFVCSFRPLMFEVNILIFMVHIPEIQKNSHLLPPLHSKMQKHHLFPLILSSLLNFVAESNELLFHSLCGYPKHPSQTQHSQGVNSRSFHIKEAMHMGAKNLELFANAGTTDGGAFIECEVPFPTDYTELLYQAKGSVQLALWDQRQLMEIEFPTAGLESVQGDGEGGTEMSDSMLLIREFCDIFINTEKAARTRIFFPEANEVKIARKSVFGGASFKLDYLTKPSLFEDFGFVSKVKMADRVMPEDELFLVAYPYFNVNEMIVVEELYKEAVEKTTRSLIVFNGELDRIRSGYYPPFFYPKLAALSQTFLPKIETVYYIHNFKGIRGGTLFRCYPGPWKVIRKVRNRYVCLHQQEVMPSLKEVALDILPSVIP